MAAHFAPDHTGAQHQVDRGWVLVNMENFSEDRPPQHNGTNISSAQQATHSSGYDAAAAAAVAAMFDRMAISAGGAAALGHFPFVRDINMDGDDHNPSSNETSGSGSTAHGSGGERQRAQPGHQAAQPPPALPAYHHHHHYHYYYPRHHAGQMLTSATLEFQDRYLTKSTTPGIAEWARDARPRVYAATISGDYSQRGFAGSSIGDTDSTTTAPSYYADHDYIIAAAGSWADGQASIDGAGRLNLDESIFML